MTTSCGAPNSAILDAASTVVVGGRQAKVLAWYENEWGYSCRLADVASFVGERLWRRWRKTFQMTSDIRLQRVYEGSSPGDGKRVLVDRVWPRDLRKESLALDLWLREGSRRAGRGGRQGCDPVPVGR
jgi:hypothetical protein